MHSSAFYDGDFKLVIAVKYTFRNTSGLAAYLKRIYL